MKRPLILLLALALALGFAALAEGEQVAMRIVSCPEQGFATLCKPEYDYSYVPDGGLTIGTTGADAAASVSIFKTDAPGKDFDANYYLNHVYADLMRSSYGGDLLQLSDVTEYTLGGRKMPARMVIYMEGGEQRMRFCAYDLREECFVRYEAFSRGTDSEMETALKMLAVAVGNFQPDADYYAKLKQGS